MILSFTHRSSRGEKFSQGAFDVAVGSQIPLVVNSHPSGFGRLVAARVEDDGSAVHVTVETELRVRLLQPGDL